MLFHVAEDDLTAENLVYLVTGIVGDKQFLVREVLRLFYGLLV